MGMCSRKKGELLLKGFRVGKGGGSAKTEHSSLHNHQSLIFSKIDSHECTSSSVHVPYQIKEKT